MQPATLQIARLGVQRWYNKPGESKSCVNGTNVTKYSKMLERYIPCKIMDTVFHCDSRS